MDAHPSGVSLKKTVAADLGMPLATALLKQWPRTSAALGFGAAGTALSLLWWIPVIFQSPNALPFVLFIGVPGLSAAIAGCLLGNSLLDGPPSQGRELPRFVAPPSHLRHCYFLPRYSRRSIFG